MGRVPFCAPVRDFIRVAARTRAKLVGVSIQLLSPGDFNRRMVMPSRSDTPRSSRTRNDSRRLALLFLGVTVGAILVLSAERAPSAPQSTHANMGTAAGAMTEESMVRWVHDWFATHPARGQNASAAAADTFTTNGLAFDTDGNNATQIDTARIQTGETILWRWTSLAHTTTNGDGAADPAAGSLWDQALTPTSPQFSFTFTAPGTYPFFCRPHEGFNMKGVVVVSDPASVPAATPGNATLAFVAGPGPNPTTTGVRFQFSLARPGRVRAQLFDLSGHLIAKILDGDFTPGVHAAGWDGRTLSGSSAAPGIYYLSLSANGARLTRQVSVIR
jgi:plastocyanin